MHSKRLLDLLVIGLSALSVAEATFVNARVDSRNVKAIQQRQEVDDETPSPNATGSETNSPSPSPIPSSTPPPKPSSQPPKPSEPSTPPSETTTSSKTTTSPQPGPSSNKPITTPPSPTKPPAEETTPPPADQSQSPSKPVIKTITSVETVTNSDGTKETRTSEVVTTSTPSLVNNNNGNGNGGSGMSPQTRNTVIGVVVGVGGAIILIGLGFVAWRVWGRKKNQDEGLMDYSTPNDGKSEVGGSMSGRTPFQSTLESYHAPTQVNQAANF